MTHNITKANNLRYIQQYNKLSEQEYPDIQELASFLETEQSQRRAHKLRALKLKYQAMTTVPTTLEKTMSPYQLYQTGSPLWVTELSANGIESFLALEDSVKYNLEDSMGYDSELSDNDYKLSKLIFEQMYTCEVQSPHSGTTDFSSYYPKILMDSNIMTPPKIMAQP